MEPEQSTQASAETVELKNPDIVRTPEQDTSQELKQQLETISDIASKLETLKQQIMPPEDVVATSADLSILYQTEQLTTSEAVQQEIKQLSIKRQDLLTSDKILLETLAENAKTLDVTTPDFTTKLAFLVDSATSVRAKLEAKLTQIAAIDRAIDDLRKKLESIQLSEFDMTSIDEYDRVDSELVRQLIDLERQENAYFRATRRPNQNDPQYQALHKEIEAIREKQSRLRRLHAQFMYGESERYKEKPSPTFETIINPVTAKILEFYQKQTEKYGQIDIEPLKIDPETLESLHDDYITKRFLPKIKETIQRYEALIKNGRYRDEYHQIINLLNNDSVVNRLIDQLRRGFDIQFDLQHSYSLDPEVLAAKERLNQYQQELDALGQQSFELKNLIEEELQRYGLTINERYQQFVDIVQRHGDSRPDQQVQNSYRKTLTTLHNLFNDYYRSGETHHIKSRVDNEFYLLRRNSDEKELFKFLADLDSQYWNVFRTNKKILDKFGQHEIESFERQAVRLIVDQVTDPKQFRDTTNRDEIIKLSYQLLKLGREPDIIPLAVINAFRHPGHSGEYPFVNTATSGRDKTPLYQFIERFDQAELARLDRLGIPGLKEIIRLIKENPTSYNTSIIKNPELHQFKQELLNDDEFLKGAYPNIHQIVILEPGDIFSDSTNVPHGERIVHLYRETARNLLGEDISPQVLERGSETYQKITRAWLAKALDKGEFIARKSESANTDDEGATVYALEEEQNYNTRATHLEIKREYLEHFLDKYQHAHDLPIKRQIDNPVVEAIQKHLASTIGHLMKKSDPQTTLFLAHAGERLHADISPIYEQILARDLVGDPDIDKMLERRLSERRDPKAVDFFIKALERNKEYAEAFASTLSQFTAGVKLFATSRLRYAVYREDQETQDYRNRLAAAYDEALQFTTNLTAKAQLLFMNGYNSLQAKTDTSDRFVATDVFTRNLVGCLQDSPEEAARFLVRRQIRLNDQRALAQLTEQFTHIVKPETRQGINKAIIEDLVSTYSYHSPEELRKAIKDATILRQKVTDWLGSSDLAVVRQAASLFEQLAQHHDLSNKKDPTDSPELSETGLMQRQYFQELRQFLQEQIGPQLLEHPDRVVRYFGLELMHHFTNNQDASTALNAAALTDSLLHETEISAYDPSISSNIYRLSTLSVNHFTPDEVAKITAHLNEKLDEEQSKDLYSIQPLVIALSLSRKLSHEQEQPFTNLNAYEIDVRNFLPLLAEGDISQLTPENCPKLLLAYVYIEALDNPSQMIPEETVKQIKAHFGSPEGKDLALKTMRQYWHQGLATADGSISPAALTIAAMIRKFEGAGHLRYVESIANFIDRFQKAKKAETTMETTMQGLITGLRTMEERMVRERWDETEKANFYDISSDVLEAAPSLYNSFLTLFERLSPKTLSRFVDEIYPLYQAQLIIVQDSNAFAYGQRNIRYNPKQLALIRRQINELIEQCTDPATTDAALATERDNLLEFLKLSFKERFGLIKIPERIDRQKIRLIQNTIRFIGNINDRNETKETLLSFYLGLSLNDQWRQFRAGQSIDPAEYLEDRRLYAINNYLEERKFYEVVTSENLKLDEQQLAEFQAILQEEVVSQTIGNVETIDTKLGQIIRSIEDLADEDAYTDDLDKAILRLYKDHGKLVGAALAKTFNQASGRPINLSAPEQEIQDQLAAMFEVKEWHPETVKTIQDRTKALALVTTVLRQIEGENVKEEIVKLQELLKPSPEVIQIFKRLGEEFRPTSGALALSQDLAFLQNLIVRNEHQLSEAEKVTLTTYLGTIESQMQQLERVLERTKEGFQKIKQSAERMNDEIFLNRVSEIEKIIYSQQSSTEIVTLATTDLNNIIENMRQCLGCLRKEINNDTNLSFGDSSKFFIMSQGTESERGSIADQIIYFFPVKYGSQQDLSFVFDQLYGMKTTDVLVGHITAIYKKFKKLKEQFPEAPVSLFITDATMVSAGADSETLTSRLRETLDSRIALVPVHASVNVPQSAGSDHYIEFGGEARQAGTREVGGFIIR